MANAHTRLDLTDWIIHFVHDRKSDDDMYVMADAASIETGEKCGIVSYFDKQGNPVDLRDEYLDKEFSIAEEESAFVVLQKIIHDGYIRSGWSFRHDTPTKDPKDQDQGDRNFHTPSAHSILTYGRVPPCKA